ncbi:uncharacterized protein VP01_5330g1, partial [Puccinia sorghi]
MKTFSIQLAIARCCLGYNVNVAAALRLKNLFQVGYRKINLHNTRVITEKVQLYQVMQEEVLPACIGFVDGTKIQINQKHPVDGNHYFPAWLL